MLSLDKPQLLFYQKIGELFYAIAAADKIVRKTEHELLKKIVATHWEKQVCYKDAFGEDAAYHMKVVFDWFDYEQLDAHDCFDNFADYKMEHPKLFNDERNQLICKTATAIATSFSSINKSELLMLAKLKQLLFE